jgi:hypothetical protein
MAKAMAKTRVEAELEAAEGAHADDPPRAELLRRARRFKTSWIELAEALTDARKHGDWQRWGYPSFEAYTKTELHLRSETVDKLTGSFLFLKKKAPEVLARNGLDAPIPSYQAVDFLRRAEDREDAPSEAVQELRHQVLEESAPMTRLNRDFREKVFPLGDTERRERDTAAIRNVAGRLRELLGETDVLPRSVAKALGDALDTALAAVARRDAEDAA